MEKTKKKILIVDDEEGFTTLVKIQLEKAGGYEVLVENESTKALDAAREFSPDVILLDIVMPGMDGGDISAALGKDKKLKSIPVVVVTALVSSADTDESNSEEVTAGDRIVLAKPLKTKKLIGVIERVIAR